jgi:hypothetical protein
MGNAQNIYHVHDNTPSSETFRMDACSVSALSRQCVFSQPNYSLQVFNVILYLKKHGPVYVNIIFYLDY